MVHCGVLRKMLQNYFKGNTSIYDTDLSRWHHRVLTERLDAWLHPEIGFIEVTVTAGHYLHRENSA